MSRIISVPGIAWSVVMVLGSGCATSPEAPAPKEVATEVQSAPVGSHIRRKTPAMPRQELNRDEIERARVQQGAIQTGLANDGK